MQAQATARGRIAGAVVLAVVISVLPGPVPAQNVAPLRLTAADLPDLTLASSDGLRIGRAALPETAPPLPPARTAARVAGRALAPVDPQVAALAPVAPVPLPDSGVLALLPPVAPAAMPHAALPGALAAVRPLPLPQAPAALRAAAVPPARLDTVTPGPLASRWPDPQDPADRSLLEGIFGTALPPGLLLDPPTPADPKVLALAVQTELQRLNCYRGALDGDWGRGSRSALEAYGTAAKAMPETLEPTSALLQALKARPDGKLCPDPARARPATTTAAPAPSQPARPAAPKAQPAPKPQPAKKQPDLAIIGL